MTTCPACDNFRRVAVEDDSREKGYSLVTCSACCCPEGHDLIDGLCLYGCVLAVEYASAIDWEEAAVRMQRMASLQQTPSRVLYFCRRRNYCAKRCEGLGGKPWSAISEAVGPEIAAGFSHVFEAPAVLQ